MDRRSFFLKKGNLEAKRRKSNLATQRGRRREVLCLIGQLDAAKMENRDRGEGRNPVLQQLGVHKKRKRSMFHRVAGKTTAQGAGGGAYEKEGLKKLVVQWKEKSSDYPKEKEEELTCFVNRLKEQIRAPASEDSGRSEDHTYTVSRSYRRAKEGSARC